MNNESHESNAAWGLVEPFDIDGEGLDGIRAQECFALGVEWQIFRSRLQNGRPFTTLVLANNSARLTKLAERSQRFVESRPASDGWAELTVGGYRV
jgi:hypothetical protein